jgi:two-component system chemotaxis response regulator CheY
MNPSFHDQKILIVDDMPQVIERLRNLYESIGLQVVGTAADGVEALKACKELRPDLVSMDIIMPVMDGVECYRKLRDSAEFSQHRPRVFFMSYLSVEPKIIESYKEEIPAHLFVVKSYTKESLLQCLHQMFGLPPESPQPTEADVNPSLS